MTRLVVVAPLKPGARGAARLLVESGPPFDPGETRLTAHEVFLTDHEAVFLFEGEDARKAVEELAGDPGVWRAATAWRECLDGRPRIADETYVWTRSS